MSTEPLLPSYASATQPPQSRSRYGSITPGNPTIRATPMIRTLSALVFTCTAIVATVWASRSYTTPQPAPPASAPLLPYFASLSLIVSFVCWIGYLVSIAYDVASGPRIQRKIIIWTSVAGKLVLAGAHIGFWQGYRYFFLGAVQPNWALMFLAAQAWWDFMLHVVYRCL